MHIATTTKKMNFLTINCRKKAKNVICMADLYCTQTFFSTLYQIYFKIQATEPPLIFHFYLTWAKYLSEFSLITSCPQSVLSVCKLFTFPFSSPEPQDQFKTWHKLFLGAIIIPHTTSCGGYNVFDPSVSQSVSQSVHQPCFSCQHNSFESAQQNFVKFYSYEGHNV